MNAGPASGSAVAATAKRDDSLGTLWFEALVVGWLLVFYDLINNLAPLSRGEALVRAESVLSFERSLHIGVELAINRWLAAHALLGYIASSYYDLAHFLVTFGVFGLLYWKRSSHFRRLRTQLVLINLVAFVVFWRFPVAPPRMLSGVGFTDIVARTDALVSFHNGALAHDANQYAAMPSLHVAWALWSSLALWRMYSNRIVRAFAIVMPIVTSVVVIATGNHFLLDVFAGAATFLFAWAVSGPCLRASDALRRRLAEARRRRAAAPSGRVSDVERREPVFERGRDAGRA